MQLHNITIALEDLVPSLDHLAVAPLAPKLAMGIPLEKYLRFTILSDEPMLLPVLAITDVKKLALSDILPVPQVPAWVLGLHYRQGKALWMIDFAHFLGRPSMGLAGTICTAPMVIVLDVEGKHLGLVVPEVQDIEMHDPNQFQQALLPSSRPFPLVQIAKGYDPESGLILLDPQRIVATELLVSQARSA